LLQQWQLASLQTTTPPQNQPAQVTEEEVKMVELHVDLRPSKPSAFESEVSGESRPAA